MSALDVCSSSRRGLAQPQVSTMDATLRAQHVSFTNAHVVHLVMHVMDSGIPSPAESADFANLRPPLRPQSVY